MTGNSNNNTKIIIGFIVVALLLIGTFFYTMSYYIDKSGQPDLADETNPQEDDQSGEIPKMDKMNLLVLGIDSRDSDFRGRTDTIIVVSVDPNEGNVNMVSIPRDTRVKIKGAWDKVNAAYVYGGEELAQEAIQDLLDVKIDHYAVIDFKGFERLVDIVGGIEVDVPIDMYYSPEGIDLKKGEQVLDGADALAYSRFRYTKDGDIGRAKRQQQVIKLLIDELLQAKNILKAPQLIDTAIDNVQTDIPITTMVKLAKIGQSLKSTTINSIVLDGKNEKIDGLWFYEPSEASIMEASKLLS